MNVGEGERPTVVGAAADHDCRDRRDDLGAVVPFPVGEDGALKVGLGVGEHLADVLGDVDDVLDRFVGGVHRRFSP